MAQIVSMVGTTHLPFWIRRTAVPEDRLTEDGRRLLAWSARVQDHFERVRPDVVVILASDHFHQFFANNMPQFVVGRMSSYEGTFANEVREFDLPRVTLGGNKALSTDVIEAGFDHGFDFAFSDEMKLDHSCVVPSLICQPSLEIPVVPILSNCGVPPMPKGQRFVDLGPALRAAIEGSTSAERVSVVVSGHLSLDVGGPEQFASASIDPEFDELAMTWLVERDFDALVAGSTYERLMKHGNNAFQFLNMITMASLQQDMDLVFVEALQRQGSPIPCFIYELSGAAA